ncbi:MAG: RDD family protein [Candidatus Delongbacteria bacterium]
MKLRTPRRAHFEPIGLGRQQALAGARFASFRRRALAFLVDFGLLSLGLGLCLLPGALHGSGDGQVNMDFTMDIDPFHGWPLLSLPLYFGLLTWWGRGQTPGKKWLGIRVESLVHERLTLWHSVERSLGYAASVLEGGFGFAQYYIHPNRQTVHDRIAETIVIRVEAPAALVPVADGAPAPAAEPETTASTLEPAPAQLPPATERDSV